MKTFKIIGVRPLKGCNKHVIKNLKSDTFYTFYNNYEFKDEKVIKSEQQVPDNLYASNISLHAIVGMNGSGKSTIVELIIRIINNLSFYILGEQSGTYAAEPLVPVRRLNAELYYEKDNVIYKITISNDSFSWTDERGNIMGKIVRICNLYFIRLSSITHIMPITHWNISLKSWVDIKKSFG